MTKPGLPRVPMILAAMLALPAPAAAQESTRSMIRDRDLRVGMVDDRDVARRGAQAAQMPRGTRTAATASGAARPGYREPTFRERVDNWWTANFRPSRTQAQGRR